MIMSQCFTGSKCSPPNTVLFEFCVLINTGTASISETKVQYLLGGSRVGTDVAVLVDAGRVEVPARWRVVVHVYRSQFAPDGSGEVELEEIVVALAVVATVHIDAVV